MDIFGFVIAFGLIMLLSVPAVVLLALIFAYVRTQRGQPVDINTGISAYAVILLGASAIVITLGVASLLTALMGEIDYDYTYGESFEFSDDFFGDEVSSGLPGDERQGEDVAEGLALIIAGLIAGAAHFWLRSRLKARAVFDNGVEGAWDMFLAIVLGATLLVAIASVLDSTFTRSITDNDSSSPGDLIAAMWALFGLWAVYAYRALRHVRIDLFSGARSEAS